MAGAAQTARMVLRAPETRSAMPIRVPAPALRAAQAASAVRLSQPSDPAEREAARVARHVVGMPAAASVPTARRFNAVVPTPSSALPSSLGVGSSAGQPLPRRLRRDMEPRFGADFSGVRVHTGDAAAKASRRLNAAAFTAGRDVFFGRGRFQPEATPGRELIAHELAHTIQQGAAAQPATVQRSVDTAVRERSAPQVQRLGIQDALDYLAEKAAWIPGFSMLALLLGFNPVSLRSVPRTAANLLRALVQLIPGGALITQALDNHGIVDRVAAWAEGQLSALGDIGSAIRQAIDDFLDGLGWSDIFDLGGVWERAKRIVTTPIDRIIAFGAGLVGGIIGFIKDAILRPIAALIEPTRGYPLLKAVLGFDPVTGDAVPRTAATLLGGFMTLIGQEEVWQNIQRGNAIGRAWAWFQGALLGLMGLVLQLPTNFLNAFRSLELLDIVLVPRALAKVIGVFASFYGQLFSWALGTVISLLEIILSVVAPGAMDYLRRAGAAFQSILRNPVGFCMNLVRAAKAGLQRFARNFLKHLVAGLLDWLTDSLPGIHIPQSFSLPEIFKFVMSVLGLTWANLRVKLVREVGEPAVKAMEAGFEVVVTLVRDGPVAAWEQLKQSLSDLKQMAIDGIMGMVLDFVVVRAIPKLVSLFIPGPGFITAAIAIYDTVMTFMRQLSRLAHLVKGYIDAIVAIASGSIDTAAAAVEAQAARYMSLAITILAGMAGFGKVGKRVQDVLERIRKPIDKAMDRVVGWVVGLAKRVGKLVSGAPTDRLAQSIGAVEKLMRVPGTNLAKVEAGLPAIQRQFALASLRLVAERKGSYRVEATVNPSLRGQPAVLFTAAELQEIERVGKQWAKEIKAKGNKAAYLSDKRGFLTGENPKVKTGDLVEAASIEEVAAYAAGLTVIVSPTLQLVDAGGQKIGGPPAELDALVIGTATVVDVISAKLKPRRFSAKTDRKLLRHFVEIPLGPPGIVAYAQTHFGTNKRYVDVSQATVIHTGGTEPLAAFRTRYLAGVIVDQVNVVPMTPGPATAGGIQLVATEAQLVDKVIEFIDANI